MPPTQTKPQAITIMGPTAAGKTGLAIELLEHVEGEIISVDSALVYRGMDIGTAKPSSQELSIAPHRLIDIRDPAEVYSAADFCRDAKREIENVIARGKTPILVGGTMLYFKALIEGLSDLPEADPVIREQIEVHAKDCGWPAVHAQLQQVDPVSAEKIHPNHSQRLSRALEVYRITGKPLSSFHGHLVGGVEDQYHWMHFAIAPRRRQILHDRIALRFKQMLKDGFLEEMRGLIARGDLHENLPSMRSVGYRQAWDYLHDRCSYEDMVEQGIVATRRLAKRQLTWLRSWEKLNWLDLDDETGQIRSNAQNIANVLKILEKRTI
ncbi:tRNA dimethylallyltransferase [Thalassocella blandensis]|nr:tRNA dimethylallyltransferase [Thalassocella blandensis]